MKRFCGRIFKLCLIPALLAVSQLLMAAPQYYEFSETVVCPSNDGYSEEIYIEGLYRIQAQFVERNAHVTSLFQVFWQGDAEGLTSGARYILRGKWMEVIQENPPYIFIWNDHFQLIGEGQAENFNTYFKIKLVANANGEMTVDTGDVFECESF